MKEYDIVVIGAGNGGLTAAAVAAKAGARVLLVEQHNLPGGFASSFVRGRFEFEPSLHELCGMGTPERPGNVRRIFDKLDIDVDWRNVPEAYRLITLGEGENNMDVTLPFGIRAFIDRTEEYVPGSRESVEKFFSLCIETQKALVYMAKSHGKPDPAVMAEQYGNYMRSAPYSMDTVCDALGMPGRAKAILNTYWSYLGVDGTRSGFAFYGLLVLDYIANGAVVPSMRSHEISMALDKRIRDFGGDIWYNTRAEKILMKDGKVCGVHTAHGDVACSQVIADCSPHAVFGSMLDRDQVPEEQWKVVNSQKLGSSALVLYMGLNKSAEELGIHEYSVFAYNSMDTADEAKRMSKMETNVMMGATCLNTAIPECSPKGTCIVSIISLYTDGAWDDVKPEDYAAKKSSEAARLIDVYEKTTGIIIKPYIEEIEVAAPPTFARYTLNPGGVIYGFEASDWDNPQARFMMRKKDVLVPGISFAGAYGPNACGFSSTYAGGEQAARSAVKALKEDM